MSYTCLVEKYGGKGEYDPKNIEMTQFLENWLLRCPTIVPEEGSLLSSYLQWKFGGSQSN